MYVPSELEASGPVRATRLHVLLLAAAALVCGAAGIALLPRAIEAQRVLIEQSDPAVIADHALDGFFDAEVAAREIEAALAANDANLAKSFIELADERRVSLQPELVRKVEAEQAEAASAGSRAERFARGLIIGEPDDLVSLAGTAVGDLFVFGDIRDAVREGARWASGQDYDRLILGLSCVGLAITAGTYATLGTGAPARIGLSLVKAARRTGRLGAQLGDYLARGLRAAVDWSVLRKALARASLTEPAVAVRAARETVKVEKAGGLMTLMRDVGRVQTKAGAQAAFDGLRLAESPRDVARLAQLAESKGGKTRAILKLLGRGAIMLSLGAFNLVWWIVGAALTLFGFVSSAKGTVERATWRHLQRRKARRFAQMRRQLALATPAE
jgi:hypothetical protein